MSGRDAAVLSDLDEIGAALVRLDAAGVLTFVGGAWGALSGDDGAHAIGKPLWELAEAAHCEDLARSVRALLAAEQDQLDCEFEVASTGESQWVELRLRAVPEPRSGVAAVGMLWNITARKQGEAEALAHREQHAHLLAWAASLHAVVTMEQLLESARQEVRARVGYDDTWLFMLQGEGDEQYGELVAHSGSHRDAVEHDVRILPIKGDAMLEELVRGRGPVVVDDARTDPRTNKELVAAIGSRTLINVPLLLVDRLLGSFGTGTYADVGPKPPTEAQLAYLVAMASHMAVAAGRIRFLDQERENQKLRERVLQAERLDSLGVLAGGVAHDFNNMLAVVLANAQLAQRKLPPSSPVRAYVNDLQEAAARAAKLSEQIRAFSGRADTNSEPIDVAEIVAETVELVRGSSAHAPNIMFERPHTPMVVIGDRAQIQQVVMNLLANAADAHNGARAPITVALTRRHLDVATSQLLDGEYVHLSVRDEGLGMAPDVAARVFEPFFTTKRDARGLGMAVVKGLVTAHKGQVEFETAEGRGTEFSVMLPWVDAELPAAAATVEPPLTDIPGTVLVVDDELPVRDSTAAILEDYGCRVASTGDGAEAIEMVRRAGADISVVLLDLRMPKLDGREVFAELRKTHGTLPVLFASGFPVDDVQSLIGTDPNVDFVQKPYDYDLLLRQLTRLTQTRARKAS